MHKVHTLPLYGTCNWCKDLGDDASQCVYGGHVETLVVEEIGRSRGQEGVAGNAPPHYTCKLTHVVLMSYLRCHE